MFVPTSYNTFVSEISSIFFLYINEITFILNGFVSNLILLVSTGEFTFATSVKKKKNVIFNILNLKDTDENNFIS